MENGGISYRRILTVKHSTFWSLQDWSGVFLAGGSAGIVGYAMLYTASYKELLLLGGVVAVATAIPLLIGFRRWRTDPRNAPPGFARWEFEAWKEEVFLRWCRTQNWYDPEGHSDLELREAYRTKIEEQVRSLDMIELFEWCREHLEEKSFWKQMGEFATTALGLVAEVGLYALVDGE